MTRRILLIEDEPISQDIIRALLMGQGYVVDVVTDGFSALDRAKAVAYDAALVDYHLPEMDGYALGRLLLEQRGGAAGGPVLIGLTADRNGLAARRGADAVFRAILPKPIKPADLFETIERLCSEPVGTGTTARPGPVETSSTMPASTGPDAARLSTAALWRGQGLASHPKAFICPPPAADQAAALGLCFDLVEAEQAEMIVLLERHGINEAIRVAGRKPNGRLPVVGLSADHADICDGVFRVDDATSWRMLAGLLGCEASPVVNPTLAITDVVVALPISPPAAAVQAPVLTVVAERDDPREGESGPAPASAVTAVDDHDLRGVILSGIGAPLMTLRGVLQAQMRLPGDAGMAPDRLAEGLAAIDQALLVTGAVADFLKAPHVTEPQASPFDPAELVENATAMIRDAMDPGGPRLACRIDPSIPARVSGDVHRLSQIVLTLLDDACSLHGDGTLTLSLSPVEGASGLAFRLLHEPEADAGEIEWKRPCATVIGQLRAIRMATLRRLVALIGASLDTTDGAVFHLSVPVTPDLQGHGEATAAAIDQTVRGAIVEALGLASVERLTGQLLAQISALSEAQQLPADTGAPARLVELSSCAAVLGLAELATRCAAFAPIASGTGDAAHARRAALAAVGRARQMLEAA